MNDFNPWQARLRQLDDISHIRARAGLTPTPLTELDRVAATEALSLLRLAFAENFYVSEKTAFLIREILQHAAIGTNTRFPDRKSFLTNVYTSNIPPSIVEPVCLTGLAGVGKSSLLRACARVLPADEKVRIDRNHEAFPCQSIWRLELTQSASMLDLFEALFKQSGGLKGSSTTIARMQKCLEQLSYRNGLSLISVDEFQFVSQSSSANALVAKILLGLRALGTPLVYAANFSLLHRLSRRNQEDQQRLLSRILMLDREDADSDDWRNLVNSYTRIAPRCFMLDPKVHGDELWRLSAGLPRTLREILVTAYSLCREKKKSFVEIEDCRLAFNDESLRVWRTDTLALNSQTLTGRPVPGRPDLLPPCNLTERFVPNATADLREADAKARTIANLKDSLNSHELKAFDQRSKKDRYSSDRKRSAASGSSDVLSNLHEFKRSIR